ncbi:unnamed protein product [Schistosoma mattheei]|uniref:WASH-7_N domain-containing protein n=1 Tax=Schistosoma mattheei TaxID=31246 RepID=A0AA85B0G3_9TREM|nr:unnamed protein product [Schistosoma mattheei]
MKNCTIFIVLENTVSNLMASSRLIKRYDLNRLKVEIELTLKKPTLAELTHYYRLNRLIQAINETYHFYEHLINQLKWLHTIIKDESNKMNFIIGSILKYRNQNSNGIPVVYYIFKISNIMVEICESRKLSISNIINNRMVVEYNDNNNLMNSTIDLEIFISELHVLVDYFFEYLCYFMVNLRNQISVNENFIRSFTSTSFTMSMKSSNVSSSSSSSSSSSASSSSRLTCPVITSNSISKLIDDLIDIESHMPMKYNEQYTEAQKRLSIRINLQVNKNKE